MLASYRHNFIFIKTQKTGSTTVETVFADFCGPDDIVTPLGHKDERRRSNVNPVCRNFESTKELEEKWIAAILNNDTAYRSEGGGRSMKFYSHMPADEIKTKLAPSFWKGAFKFTTERHPYEKVVSKAFFNLRKRDDLDRFHEILDAIIEKETYRSMRHYTINDQVVVDDIVKLENLRSDLQRVADRIGVKLPDELPHMKSDTRRDPRPARDILSNRQKRRIYRACKAEFELLGYER